MSGKEEFTEEQRMATEFMTRFFEIQTEMFSKINRYMKEKNTEALRKYIDSLQSLLIHMQAFK